MKLFITLALSTVVSGTALAQVQEVKETKTKITCVTNLIQNQIHENGTTFPYSINRKSSESIRTTWSDGRGEYRLSDYQSFGDNGEVFSVGRGTARFTSVNEGNKITETIQSHNIVRYRDDFKVRGGNLKELKEDAVNVYYKINDNERVLISTSVNGKSEPTRDLREITTKLSDTVTSVKYVESTPYVEEVEGMKIEVLKFERTCEFQTLK